MIHLPKLFASKLEPVPKLDAAVRTNFERFEPWLEQSGMPFFPGFTDHSPRHISEVLQTAAALIPDASHELITPEDVTVLCMATLLHDCGMHLTQSGLRAIVADEGPTVITGLNDVPWSALWEQFLGEASRFGEEKLLAIFGDNEPYRVDTLDIDNLTERDCLLAGEFVRRHHARLAHEVAVAGVPGNVAQKLTLLGLDEDMCDVAGLVARSHGMSIRSTFDFLKSRYGRVSEYRRIKAPYLMAILRIADYMQVHSERALKSLLSVRELRSPISRQEWRAHFAVNDVSVRHEDPEAFYVHATPKDVRTYLKLTSLFADIQREMDESWATLGEVYGRLGDLSQLGLMVRRLRSNLDEEEVFARTVPYIPIEARFTSSGARLLKLLVGPLYGYNYSIGIRELLQNAVDACKEIDDLRVQGRATAAADTQKWDVLIEMDEQSDGTGWVTVTDCGVGMTLETIQRYFLVAGASFRDSEVWKQQHTGASGEPRPMRGGRFGIGALAAYLLGEEITVTTRHFTQSASAGVTFTARIDDPQIEMRWHVVPQVGTCIRVRVTNQNVFEGIRPPRYGSWDSALWFRQATPRVLFQWRGPQRDYASSVEGKHEFKELIVPGEMLVPSPGTEPADWQRLGDPAPYREIYWRHSPPREASSYRHTRRYRAETEQVTVNGIYVQSLHENLAQYDASSRDGKSGPGYEIPRPTMAILDPASRCPLNLQRSSVAFGQMGKDTVLTAAVIRHHVNALLCKADLRSKADLRNGLAALVDLCKYAVSIGGVQYTSHVLPLGLTRDGFTLANKELLTALNINTLLFIDLPNTPLELHPTKLLPGEIVLLRHPEHDLAWFRTVLSMGRANVPVLETGLNAFAPVGAALVVENQLLADAQRKVRKLLMTSITAQPLSKSHSIASKSRQGHGARCVERVAQLFEVFEGKVRVSSWELRTSQQNNQRSPAKHSTLVQTWLELVGGPMLR